MKKDALTKNLGTERALAKLSCIETLRLLLEV